MADGTRTAAASPQGFPTVTVTETIAGTDRQLEAVLTGIDDLQAKRELTSEELLAGISSLDPPTVSTGEGDVVLSELLGRAVCAAVESQRDLAGHEAVMLQYKTHVSLQMALAALAGEELSAGAQTVAVG